MRTIRQILLTGALAGSLLACGAEKEPEVLPPALRAITAEDALATANRNLRQTLLGAARAGQQLQGSELLARITPGAVPCVPDMPCEEPEELSLEEQATETADRMAEHVFHLDNVEAAEATKIVLRLTPEKVCSEQTDDNGNTVRDPACVRSLSEAPIRLELTSRSEGDVDARLTVGQYAPGSLSLHDDHLGAELDLGAALGAARQIAALTGDEIDFDGSLRGRIQVALRRNGEADYSASVSVLSELGGEIGYENETATFSVAPSNPLLLVRMDGVTPQVIMEHDVGAISAELPLALMFGDDSTCASDPNGEPCPETPSLEGLASLRFPGSSGRLTLDQADQVRGNIQMDGPMTLSAKGVTMYNLDLNPDARRAMDYVFSSNADTMELAVKPGLDARLALNLSPVAEELEVPAGLRNQNIRVTLDGAAEPRIRFENGSDAPVGNDPQPTNNKILEVLAGRLELRDNQSSVVVQANACLLSDDAHEPTENDGMFSGLVAGACN